MRLFRRKEKLQEPRKDEGGGLEASAKRDVLDMSPPLRMLLNSMQEMDRKPPVTLALIGVMYVLHVQATRTPSLLLPFALCPGNVMANKSIGAVFVAPFIHFEDFHLYQSLVSLLWKGYNLEERLGSIGFCVLLVYLITLCQALIVFGAHLIPWGAAQEHFTGFSGVLTAMKVILTVNSPTFTTLYSFQVPTKYAAWLELFITYLFVPKLPLLAQAAGLIAGYIYIVTPQADALVARASRNTRHFLVRIGLAKRPHQWWHLRPRFINFVQQRESSRKH